MIWRGGSALAGGVLALAAPFCGADWRERLALTGPKVSSDTMTPVVANMPMPHSATR